MARLVIVLLVLCLAAPAWSAPVDSAGAVELLRQNAHPLTLQDGELRGEGADLLMREARASQFLLVGEDHGFAEVPRFCAALFRGLHRVGYDHVAIEVGPLTAGIVTHLARSPDPVAAFRAFDVDHPWGIPFLFWREEAEWVADALRTAGGGDRVVWGLDQEFIESPQILLERLVTLARTKASKALAESSLAAAREGNRRLRQGNPTASWMVAAEETTFTRLATAFAPETSEGGRIVAELRRSRAVYQPVFRGDMYANNSDRTRLMKRHLGEYLATARAAGERPPRVLFKFGGSHTMRGRTVVNVYDLGTTLHELAELEGSHAFGLYIQGIHGTQNNYRPFGSAPADTAAALNPAGSDLYFAGDMMGAIGDATWRVIDLRPLRREVGRRGGKGIPGAVEKILWSYDAVLLVPEMHASRLLNFR